MRFYTQRGFTLIELLVVIAVISVIAAILFPVFASVREKARQTVCISNARQMGIGLAEYATDYDDHYMTRPDNDAGDIPPCAASSGDPNPADFQTWYDWIQPYIASYDVQKCPSFTGAYPIENDAGRGAAKRYARSTYLISENIIANSAVKGALSAIPNPASTIIVAESPSGATSFGEGGGATAVDYPFCPNSVVNGPGEIHYVQYIANQVEPLCQTPAISAQVTCIAADGHAKSVLMNDANDGGVIQDSQGCEHDPVGGYGGLYFTGPDGELSFPPNPPAPSPCVGM